MGHEGATTAIAQPQYAILEHISDADMLAVDELASDMFNDAEYPSHEDGWESVYTHNDPQHHHDALVIWRKHHAKTGSYEYCIFGAAPFAAKTLYSVAYDMDQHKAWDKNAGEMYVIRKDQNTQQELCYWEILYPWPMAARDYVYTRKLNVVDDGKKFVLLSKAMRDENYPEVPKKVRVTDYVSRTVIEQSSTKEKQCKYVIFMHEDIRGSIPKAMVNFFVSKVLPSFTKALYRACEAYESVNA
eukprot:CAMPEP_0184693724 /NCGR_PEP_ID=MMETSP0313-20130426/1885_1 /TAXON_ID=2792 /ORGANISM="Porphyridium aerugineum, Strain SAG 1380-2" /LENGTH=243 /DNA_ID=CAMNT_0027151873 /DNA_START=49 /DNA_END=780 /DNA_ORIENTATION=-